MNWTLFGQTLGQLIAGLTAKQSKWAFVEDLNGVADGIRYALTYAINIWAAKED